MESGDLGTLLGALSMESGPSRLAWSPSLLRGRPDFPSHPQAGDRSGEMQSQAPIPWVLASSAGATLGAFHPAGPDVEELGNPTEIRTGAWW